MRFRYLYKRSLKKSESKKKSISQKDEGIDVTVSRGTATYQSNGVFKPTPVSPVSSNASPNELPLEIDVDRMIRQVPVKLHPLFGIHLGRAVLSLLIAFIIIAMMAFVTQLNMLIWAGSLIIAVFFVSILFPGWIVNSVEITKVVPDTGFMFRPLMINYTIRNKRKYFSVYSLRIVELFDPELVEDMPRVFIPSLGPGQSYSFQIYVVPKNRGPMACLGTRIASTYPFGLLTRFRTVIDDRHVDIYPALGTLTTRLLPANRESEYQMGNTQPRYKGNSEEFFALREYRAGDNPRFIHWRRTASKGRLIVREMCQYSPHRITVILDTYLPEKNKKTRLIFEEMVSFAATVLCQTLENGYRAALVCTSIPPIMVPPMNGRPAQQRILKTLSVVEPQYTFTLPEMFESWRFSGSWSGRCLLIGQGDPGSGIISKLSEVIGPVQYFQAGSREWKGIFVPPAYLRARGQSEDV